MKNKIKFAFIASGLLAIAVYAASPNHINRFGYQSILATGGSSSTNAKTVIVTEDSTTNELSFALITATVSGSATASTNTFATPYLATPTIIHGDKSGISIASAGYGTVTPTVTTTSLIVSG